MNLENYEAGDGAFRDSEFPHSMESIGTTKSEFKVGTPDVWVQARCLGHPTEALLFDKIQPEERWMGG